MASCNGWHSRWSESSEQGVAVSFEFRETLFAHAAAGGYDAGDEDELFANAFAQTLAFGLSWPERRLAKRSVAMRIERFREASTRCSVRHYVR